MTLYYTLILYLYSRLYEAKVFIYVYICLVYQLSSQEKFSQALQDSSKQ